MAWVVSVCSNLSSTNLSANPDFPTPLSPSRTILALATRACRMGRAETTFQERTAMVGATVGAAALAGTRATPAFAYLKASGVISWSESPLRASQRRISPRSEAETRSPPSGDHRRSSTGSVCPSRISAACLCATFHTRTVPFSNPEANRPSAVHARLVTRACWPFRSSAGSSESSAHTRMVPSLEPEAGRPSAAHARLATDA